VALGLVVDQLGVFLVGLDLAGARRVLQLGDDVRRPHVLLAAHAEGVLAAASSMSASTGSSPKAAACVRTASSATSLQADALDACSACR
jgi:hypothetical protein